MFTLTLRGEASGGAHISVEAKFQTPEERQAWLQKFFEANPFFNWLSWDVSDPDGAA